MSELTREQIEKMRKSGSVWNIYEVLDSHEALRESRDEWQAKYVKECQDTDELLVERNEYKAKCEAAVWPHIIPPPQYEQPAMGWTDPRPADLLTIWKLAREVGYAVGLHGSLKRDMDLIAAPWTDEAVGNWALVEHLCEGLPAVRVNGPEHKPHGRVAVTLQMNGYYKPIDLSILPLQAQLAQATAEREELSVAVASGIRHRQDYVERINALQQRVASLEGALKELYGQVDQAREGFGIYKQSPSMDQAMKEAQHALEGT